MKSILPLLLVSTLSVFACGDRQTNIYTGPSATTPSPSPQVQLNLIEYRITGNAAFVNAKYSFPTDGLTLVTTVLPYDANFSTPLNTVFVSLEATPTTYPPSVVVPFISVQIFVNGLVFREATSSNFSLSTVSVSGTWRK